MHFAIHPSFTGDRGRFTVIAAPLSPLLSALGAALSKRKAATLYLAGGNPALFQGLIPVHHRLRLAAPESPRGLARAVADAREPYVIIEYDPCFAPEPGDAGAWLHACREQAHDTGTAVLLAATAPASLPPAVTDAADRAFLMAALPVPPRGSRRTRGTGRQMTLGEAGP
ncbi:MAG: hypothetical protein GKC04_02755 [Methanomicrobiales archaeon]|nr:hypothetical protein [Methanomicrobiales archaeon]